jgi:anti-sigma factor ChrR (cupin superfamily)
MNCTELHNLAAAHALGALDPSEVARLEATLAAHPEMRSEIARLRDAAAALALARCEQVAPSPQLRAKILKRARPTAPTEMPQSSPEMPAGFRFVLNEAGWQPGPLPGIRIKPLSTSGDMGYHVLLAELAPGTRFPEHDHGSSEELFVLSGRLHTEGRILGPGDFLHAEPGTHHHELVSPDGCVALLIERAPVRVQPDVTV